MATTTKKPVRSKKVESAVPTAPKYTVSLVIGGKEWKGEGDTLLSAMMALEKPDKMMLKGHLTISDGEKSNTLLMYPKALRRLFYNKSFLNISVKNLAMGLK